MRIFLTGATGYVGSAVLDSLVRAGHQVTALVRQPGAAARLDSRGVTPVIGELATPDRYTPAARTADAVVHAALDSSAQRAEKDAAAIDALLDVLMERPNVAPRVLVYTSGVWVIGPTPAPADEATPIAPIALSAWRAPHEQRVLEAGRNGVRTAVIRPGIVYGGRRGIVADLLKDALNGLVRVMGSGENHWACVYDRDLGDLYARVLASPEASGVFHATDEGDERVEDIVGAIARQVPMRPEIRHVPLEEARQKLGAYADALALDQRVRSPRARAIGWVPTLRSVSSNVVRLLEEFRADR
jgi:nucleoside-diphosphate-sugar epimerase